MFTGPDVARALAGAAPRPYWLDRPERPRPRPALTSDTTTDLLVVGGGFSGLWTALLAKERDPGRDVVLIDGARIGWAATGRNGGFCEASLTHGESNGLARFAAEYPTLERLGLQNLDELESTIGRLGIDCDWRRTGELQVATAQWQVDELVASGADVLDQAAIRAEVDSPTYLAGVWHKDSAAIVDPAALAWGLAVAAEEAGVRIAEHSPAAAITREGGSVLVRLTNGARIRASKVALGTNAFPSLVRRIRMHVVPVYDYVLVTEPLTDAQLASIGWANRQGIGDSANQFHYYRLTADNRILWGGYDAVYYFGRRISRAYDQRPETFHKLAAHFFETFPQLADVRFSHRWGGAIDTCTRFCAFYGTAHGGDVAYALGFTGLGVGATRFGANVMLDLLEGTPTERTELEMVRTKPVPFPPEPFAYAGIEITRRAIARADENDGRRNLWLRSLDTLGLGFDS